MPIGDDQLLREYALTRSETAFTELAARHLNWVHSAAAQMLGDSHEAQDVTQAVFLLLAQQPRKAIDKPLASWLFQVLRYNVANARRAQGRRRKHEQEAATMGPLSTDQGEERLWEHLAPQLDELIARLGSGQREALLMRFYQGKSMAEIGQSLKITGRCRKKSAFPGRWSSSEKCSASRAPWRRLRRWRGSPRPNHQDRPGCAGRGRRPA